MTFVVVFYDISSDKKRMMVAEALKRLGLTRIQRSVFMGRGGYAKAKDVVRSVRRLLDPEKDSLVVVVVPDNYVRQMMVVGWLWSNPYGVEEITIV